MFSRWALRRVYKFILKRLLGKILRNELDMEQLDVQLGAGTVELRDLSLNTEYINDQLGESRLTVTAGHIGKIKASIPWNILTLQSWIVEVDSLHLTVAPSGLRSQPTAGREEGGGEAIEAEMVYLGVDDGVRGIARLVERILLGLRVQVTDLVVTLDGQAAAPCRLLLRIAKGEWGGDAGLGVGVESEVAELQLLAKRVTFEGAQVEIVQEEEGVCLVGGKERGLCGALIVRMPWRGGSGSVAAHLSVPHLRVCLHPNHARSLLDLVAAFTSHPATGAVRGGGGAGRWWEMRSSRLRGGEEAEWASEADLAASVDEFFDCLDGSLPSLRGTLSTMSAGEVAVPPVPPHYSLAATIGSVSLILRYHPAPHQAGLGLWVRAVEGEAALCGQGATGTLKAEVVEVGEVGDKDREREGEEGLTWQELQHKVHVAQPPTCGAPRRWESSAGMGDGVEWRAVLVSGGGGVVARVGCEGGVSVSLPHTLLALDLALLTRLSTLSGTIWKRPPKPERTRRGSEGESPTATFFLTSLRVVVGVEEGEGKQGFRNQAVVVDFLAPPAATPFLRMEGRQATTVVRLCLGETSVYLLSPASPPSSAPLAPSTLLTLAPLDSRHRHVADAEAGVDLEVPAGSAAVVEARFGERAGTGPWLCQQVWEAALRQQRRMDGGAGVAGGECGGAMDSSGLGEEALLREVRRQALASSPTALLIHARHLRLHLVAEEVEQLKGLVVATGARLGGEAGASMGQSAMFAHCALVEVEVEVGEGEWPQLRLELEGGSACCVGGLGGVSSAAVVWVQHRECRLVGGGERVLYHCHQGAVGRGDGGVGGGSALPCAPTGLTLSYVHWPTGGQRCPALLALTLRGGTVVAPGGRLEWLWSLQRCLKVFSGAMVEGGSRPPALLRLLLVVDLYDTAVAYEPPSTPACVLAVSALRVGGELAPSPNWRSTGGSIWVRDGALHLLGAAREGGVYTAPAMQRSGYAKVAQAPYFELTLDGGGGGGKGWEVRCRGAEVVVETCCDSCAALACLAQHLASTVLPLPQPAPPTHPNLLSSLKEHAFAPTRAAMAKVAERGRLPEFIEEYRGGGQCEGLVGGWYAGGGVVVVENHVPHAPSPSPPTPRGSLPAHYPPSCARLHLTDCSVRWRLFGGCDWPPQRERQVCLEGAVRGVEVQHDSFGSTGAYASRIKVGVKEMGVVDCSADAPWRTLVACHSPPKAPRPTSAQAVWMVMDSVRPDPLEEGGLQELRVVVALLPLRIRLEQRHLDFLRAFLVSAPASGVEEEVLPFFQLCEVRSFSVCVDYTPRTTDLGALRGGEYLQLLNLVRWRGVEVELKGVRARGVQGWGSLTSHLAAQWAEDIAANQVHKVVAGVGPISPLYAVGVGVGQLVVLPVEQYRKEGRVWRGVRVGALALARSVCVELLGLGAQVAGGAHHMLQKGGERVPEPGCASEGVQQAYATLAQGLQVCGAGLVGNPIKVFRRGEGMGAAVAVGLKAVPAAAMAPAAATAGAVQRALLGVRNSMNPEVWRESEEKYEGTQMQRAP